MKAITNHTKKKSLNNIKKGFEEMQLIKEGKLKTTSLNDFLDKIQQLNSPVKSQKK